MHKFLQQYQLSHDEVYALNVSASARPPSHFLPRGSALSISNMPVCESIGRNGSAGDQQSCRNDATRFASYDATLGDFRTQESSHAGHHA